MICLLASDPEKKSPLSSKLSKQDKVRKSLRPTNGTNLAPGEDGRSSLGFTSEEDDDDDDDDDIPVRSTRRNRMAPIMLSSDDSPQPQTPEKPVTPTKRSRLVQGYTQASNVSSETDSEAPVSRLRQKLSISPGSTRATKGDSRAKTGPSEVKRAKNKAKPVVISDGSEDSSSENVVATPVRRRNTVAQIQSAARETDQEEEAESSDDLQGELEDLQETVTPLRNTRTRGGNIVSERSKRQEKLEELRRRRAGIREESQEGDDLGEQDDDSQDETNEVELSGSEPTDCATHREDWNEFEEDFLASEDENVGVDLGRAGVPLEFTYHANKKPFEYFKTEIEWMVHNKLNPAFDRYDEMYQFSHSKLDREVEAFAGSKFSSSVWGENFSKALQALPDLSRVDVPTMLEHKCDACRRSNHPPKHKLTFSGKSYNRDTLETIEQDDEDEDEDDNSEDSDDKSSSTQEGQTFFVGRFGFSCHFRYPIITDVV